MSDTAALADAIEKARTRYPELKVAHGAYYRNGRREVPWEEATKQPITAACVVGFAMLGGFTGSWSVTSEPILCPAGCGSIAAVIHLNDDHHWSPERIVAWLRDAGG
jgi:hypothetical protein